MLGSAEVAQWWIAVHEFTGLTPMSSTTSFLISLWPLLNEGVQLVLASRNGIHILARSKSGSRIHLPMSLYKQCAL